MVGSGLPPASSIQVTGLESACTPTASGQKQLNQKPLQPLQCQNLHVSGSTLQAGTNTQAALSAQANGVRLSEPCRQGSCLARQSAETQRHLAARVLQPKGTFAHPCSQRCMRVSRIQRQCQSKVRDFGNDLRNSTVQVSRW